LAHALGAERVDTVQVQEMHHEEHTIFGEPDFLIFNHSFVEGIKQRVKIKKSGNTMTRNLWNIPGGLYITIQVIDEVKKNHTYFLVYLYECHKLFQILII
jgi:hypothetical protein